MQKTNPRSHEAFRAAAFISGEGSTSPFAGSLWQRPAAELEARRCAWGTAGDGGLVDVSLPLQERGSAQRRAVPRLGQEEQPGAVAPSPA